MHATSIRGSLGVTEVRGGVVVISRVGQRLSDVAQKYVPDPFVLAIGLTFTVFLLALPRAGWNPVEVVDLWVDGSGNGKGLWNLLAFSMQMCLILLTGYALAETAAVRATIRRLAAIPESTGGAAVLVSLVAMCAALINWGLGLIVGALMAREVGRIARAEGRALHYPLVCAAGYTGLAVWHGGFSGSAPLKATSAKQLNEILGAELSAKIPPMLLGDTLGSSLNLTVTVACLILIPLTLYLLSPKDPAEFSEAPDSADNAEEAASDAKPTSPAEWLNHSFLVVLFPGLLGLAWCGSWLLNAGLGKLNPNVINLFMLSIGLLLHGSVRAYVDAIHAGVKSCSGIILQYPFYAGIMGIMAGSGIVGDIGAWLSGLGPHALGLATFYSGGLVNLFVPSGGGQWAVQGPVVMEAALQSGVAPSTILMALAYGDQWTNLIQPFWALPLLGICRIKVSSIIGYTAILLVVSQLCFLVPLMLFI